MLADFSLRAEGLPPEIPLYYFKTVCLSLVYQTQAGPPGLCFLWLCRTGFEHRLVFKYCQ